MTLPGRNRGVTELHAWASREERARADRLDRLLGRVILDVDHGVGTPVPAPAGAAWPGGPGASRLGAGGVRPA
ncbi:MAG: hypothetical protein ACRD0J_14745, partial [Acidimicrobiales bacterium]